MKYIITEEQHSKLHDSIIEWFDKNLTPYDGWDSHSNYKNAVKIAKELFLFIDDFEVGDSEHMWYSKCNNPNLGQPIPEGHCPVVTIPDTQYNALNGYFGNLWKPIFKQWFKDKTGLPVIQVDKI